MPYPVEEKIKFLKNRGWKSTPEGLWIDPEEKAPLVDLEDAMVIELGRMVTIPPTGKDPENVKRLRCYF